jgi:hypothetical protein
MSPAHTVMGRLNCASASGLRRRLSSFKSPCTNAPQPIPQLARQTRHEAPQYARDYPWVQRRSVDGERTFHTERESASWSSPATYSPSTRLSTPASCFSNMAVSGVRRGTAALALSYEASQLSENKEARKQPQEV